MTHLNLKSFAATVAILSTLTLGGVPQSQAQLYINTDTGVSLQALKNAGVTPPVKMVVPLQETMTKSEPAPITAPVEKGSDFIYRNDLNINSLSGLSSLGTQNVAQGLQGQIQDHAQDAVMSKVQNTAEDFVRDQAEKQIKAQAQKSVENLIPAGTQKAVNAWDSFK